MKSQRKKQMRFRSVNWAIDGDPIRQLDTSFETDRIYAVHSDGLSFSLVEKAQTPLFKKRYDSGATKKRIDSSLIAIAACEANQLRGFAVVEEETWNRRAVITDFFVDRKARGRGVGRGMLREIMKRLPTECRVLWVETQNVNFPAISFYRRMGFVVCGLDSTLYDGKQSAEIAVFLSKGRTRKSEEQKGSGRSRSTSSSGKQTGHR